MPPARLATPTPVGAHPARRRMKLAYLAVPVSGDDNCLLGARPGAEESYNDPRVMPMLVQ
eukprot:5955438-Amphidinium_carterae.1